MGENEREMREKLMKKLENASEETIRMVYAFVLGRMG